MAKLFANIGDPDQMPHSAASDLGLHCLPITLLRVSRLQWDKETKTLVNANKKTARIILFVSGFYESSKTYLVIRIIIFHFFLH